MAHQRSLIVDLTELVFKHLVRRMSMLILQLSGSLGPGSWDAVFESFPRSWYLTIWKSVGKREIFWHQSQLDQYRSLVPRNVLVV